MPPEAVFLLLIVLAFLFFGLRGKGGHEHGAHRKRAKKTAHIPEGTLVKVDGKYIPIEDALKQGATVVYEHAKKKEIAKTDFLGRPIRS